jgi:hypothetical protein
MRNFINYSLLASSLLLAAQAHADDHFRQHAAHVHGHVELNIAQDADELLVEFTAPGADVLGFEHAPENAQQEEKLAQALKILHHADNILTLPAAADCQPEHQDVRHTLTGHNEHEHEHEHEQHSDHGHDDHNHDDHEEQNHSGGHGQFTVEYHFECRQISKLDTIEIQWFSRFPATEEIEVTLLTDSAMLTTELNASEHTLHW